MSGPVVLVDLWAIPAPGANTDIAGQVGLPLTVPNNCCTLKIHVLLRTGSIFRMIRRATASGTSYTDKANGGVALAASCGFDAEVAVTPGEIANFQVETDGIIDRLIVVGITNEQS